jgi:hypothetical protein
MIWSSAKPMYASHDRSDADHAALVAKQPHHLGLIV